jgi:ADP-ribosylglycohydrolase
MHVIDRARGCRVGLAVGDALGAPHEFRRTGPVTTMTALPYLGGLPAGTWTDDTALAICLGQSLVSGRFDPFDQLAHYRRWLFGGVNSLAGPGFGAGEQTRQVLRKSKFVDDEFPGDRYPNALGIGSLMRLAPARPTAAPKPSTPAATSPACLRATCASRLGVTASRLATTRHQATRGGRSCAQTATALIRPGVWGMVLGSICCSTRRFRSRSSMRASGRGRIGPRGLAARTTDARVQKLTPGTGAHRRRATLRGASVAPPNP